MKKIIELLDKIGKDKYQHFTIGALIASVVLCICSWCELPFAATHFIALVCVLIAELVKEFCLDTEPDVKDVIATLLGGAAAGVPACFIFAHYVA